MQTNTLTPKETIEALSAKCALLAASLKQVEAEGQKAIRNVAGELDDCSDLMDCYAIWSLALFSAIERFTDGSPNDFEPLDASDRITVSRLASIGADLADRAYGSAKKYSQKAEEMRGAA